MYFWNDYSIITQVSLLMNLKIHCSFKVCILVSWVFYCLLVHFRLCSLFIILLCTYETRALHVTWCHYLSKRRMLCMWYMQNVPKCILTTIQRSYLRQYHKIGSTVCRAYITTCKCEMSTLPERSSYMYIIQTLMDPLILSLTL